MSQFYLQFHFQNHKKYLIKMDLLPNMFNSYCVLSSVIDSCDIVRRQTSCLYGVYILEEESDIT